MICVDQYLGTLSEDQMMSLADQQTPVTDLQLKLSNKTWSAFRSDSPVDWCALVKTDTTALPFLEGAIIRMLEEYPSCFNGLSRTAQNALEIIQQGENDPAELFRRYQATEDRRFLGDTGFWSILQQFLESDPPLLKLPADMDPTLPGGCHQELTLTRAGNEVLSGKRNWLDMVELDQWIGGVHLTPENIWCRGQDAGTLSRY